MEGAWGRAARGETGFSGKWIPRGRRARWPGLPESRPRPRRHFLLSMCCRGWALSAALREEAPRQPRGPRGPRAAADLVLSWPAAREWAERRGCCPATGRRAWAVLGSRGRVLDGGTPSPRGLSGLGAAATAPRGAGGRGSRAPGSARGSEPCVTAETAALGGGENPWPGAAAASVWRGEIVRLHGSGGSDRDCGLMLGGGDDRLGPVLGGFPLKEVVGHLKAQSTCF